jgi:hypothetical protein
VLLNRLDPEGQAYSEFNFGRAIASAIARNYRLEARAGEFHWVYVRRD